MDDFSLRMNHTAGLEKVKLKVKEPGKYSVILTDPSTSLYYTITNMDGHNINFQHGKQPHGHAVFYDFKIDLEAYEFMDKGKESSAVHIFKVKENPP